MPKKTRKKRSEETIKKHSSGKKGIPQLLEEIIEESLSSDCNLILLEGKIRELEGSMESFIPIMMRRMKRGNVSEQKVIFDLLNRGRDKKIVENLKEVVGEDSISIKVRYQALIQLKKFGERIDEDLSILLEQGEEIIGAIEKHTRFGSIYDRDIDSSIVLKFEQLPNNVKVSIIKQILDEYPDMVSLVLSLIQGEEDLDEAVIEILATKKTLEVGNFFSKILEGTKNKSLQRLLKRHLFRMKKRGLDVAFPTTEGVEDPKFLRIESSQVEAYVTGIDYLGERLAFLSKSVWGWGVVFFQITLSDLEGIKSFSAFELNRKAIKNFLHKISEEGVITLIEIESDYFFSLIEEAYQTNLSKGIPLPSQFAQWKSELNELRGDVTEPVIYSSKLVESLQEGKIDVWRGKYETLNDSDTLKEWFLEPRLVWKYIEKYREIEASPLVLNHYQVEERLNSIIIEAAGKIFDDTYRRIYKRRLEEMAYIFLDTHKEELAKLALCAAHDLRPDGLSSDRHGFLINLTKKSINIYAAGEKIEKRSL
ncbi:MAG: hypothetical protein J7M06_00365 [Proteobacteria bacterium]|nr:hypothetical protein [Pseudomonadota bacterium]